MTNEQKKQLEKLKEDLKKMNEKAKALKATAALILLCFFAQAQDYITVMSYGDFEVKLVLSYDEKEAEILAPFPNAKVLAAVSMMPEYFDATEHKNIVVTMKKGNSLQMLEILLKGAFHFDAIKAVIKLSNQ